MKKSLQDWEKHFADFSFCCGDVAPTQADLDLFQLQNVDGRKTHDLIERHGPDISQPSVHQNNPPQAQQFPNFCRWFKTIKARRTGGEKRSFSYISDAQIRLVSVEKSSAAGSKLFASFTSAIVYFHHLSHTNQSSR